MTLSIADYAIPAASLQYVKVPITATVSPLTDTVAFAFTAPGVAPSSWTGGTWETIGTTNYARVLVGTGGGGLPLVKGLYRVYVKITASPEIPVLDGGLLEVTP